MCSLIKTLFSRGTTGFKARQPLTTSTIPLLPLAVEPKSYADGSSLRWSQLDRVPRLVLGRESDASRVSTSSTFSSIRISFSRRVPQ